MTKKYTYVGQTENVITRFHQHNNGEEKTTKPYSPFTLILSLECKNRNEARKWEKFYKSGEGRTPRIGPLRSSNPARGIS